MAANGFRDVELRLSRGARGHALELLHHLPDLLGHRLRQPQRLADDVVDLTAFNLVVMTTHIIPLAQLFGAGSGFLVNFLYNKFKTFAVTTEPVIVERST